MRFSDVRQVAAPTAQVWTALHDSEVLRAVIPGCERLSPVSPGQYSAILAARLGRVPLTLAGGHITGFFFSELDRAMRSRARSRRVPMPL